jgi:hypothetical protein
VKDQEETLKTVRAAVRRRALEVHFGQPLHNNETQSGHFMEDPTVYNSQKVAHRVECPALEGEQAFPLIRARK